MAWSWPTYSPQMVFFNFRKGTEGLNGGIWYGLFSETYQNGDDHYDVGSLCPIVIVCDWPVIFAPQRAVVQGVRQVVPAGRQYDERRRRGRVWCDHGQSSVSAASGRRPDVHGRRLRPRQRRADSRWEHGIRTFVALRLVTFCVRVFLNCFAYVKIRG